jgi:hypothetical protein
MPTMAIERVKYQKYCNARFRYCLDYPRQLIPQPEAQNGDGRDFTSADGKVNLKVWGALDLVEGQDRNDVLNSSIQAASEGKKITYRRLLPTVYFLSGYNAEGKIFYRKTLWKNGELVSMELTYSPNLKKQYDSIVPLIVKSFK